MPRIRTEQVHFPGEIAGEVLPEVGVMPVVWIRHGGSARIFGKTVHFPEGNR